MQPQKEHVEALPHPAERQKGRRFEPPRSLEARAQTAFSHTMGCEVMKFLSEEYLRIGDQAKAEGPE